MKIEINGGWALLFVLLLILKLTNVISWSWWWVTAPVWIPFVLFIVAFMAVGAGAIVAMVFGSNHER